MKEKPFKQWVILSLMGHKQLAGLLTESPVGAGQLLRLDVPDIDGAKGFTKIFNVSSVYSIDIVDEESAMLYAGRLKEKPFSQWDLGQMFQEKVDELVKQGRLALPEVATVEDDDDEDNEDDLF